MLQRPDLFVLLGCFSFPAGVDLSLMPKNIIAKTPTLFVTFKDT